MGINRPGSVNTSRHGLDAAWYQRYIAGAATRLINDEAIFGRKAVFSGHFDRDVAKKRRELRISIAEMFEKSNRHLMPAETAQITPMTDVRSAIPMVVEYASPKKMADLDWPEFRVHTRGWDVSYALMDESPLISGRRYQLVSEIDHGPDGIPLVSRDT